MSWSSSTSLSSEPLSLPGSYVGVLVSLPLVRGIMSSLILTINSSYACLFCSSRCLLTSRAGITLQVKPMAFSLVVYDIKGVMLLLVRRTQVGCFNEYTIYTPPSPHKHCCHQKISKKLQGIGHISRGGAFFSGALSWSSPQGDAQHNSLPQTIFKFPTYIEQNDTDIKKKK